MKKSIIISLLSWEKSFRTLFVSAILFGSVSATAQLRVYSTGNIAGPGNITLKAGYTEIRNSTSVPLGTTLIIEN